MENQEENLSAPIEQFALLFKDQLVTLLEECAHGRRGLFSEPVDEQELWVEAAQLRQLAIALQQLSAQQEEPSLLADEFLDLCTIHGESNPGEARLARALLKRIEKGEVGTQPEGERRPW